MRSITRIMNNAGSHAWIPDGSLLLCNCIPKGNMKPELNQTQAIYPLQDPEPKVCVTTTIENQLWNKKGLKFETELFCCHWRHFPGFC